MMNNYEYIIAGLPVLDRDASALSFDVEETIAEIKSQCSGRDVELVDFLLSGTDGENLCADFYRRAAAHRNPFLRGYFAYDLALRNAKVSFLNKALGRPAGMDLVEVGESEAVEETAPFEAVLSRTDILERERGLDELMWEKADELVLMDVFSINVILGFVAKLKIVDRWVRLDENTGREMFRRLVEEVRGTFKGVDFKEQ